MASAAFLALLTACGQDMGYVEIDLDLARGQHLPGLSLGSTSLAFFNGHPAFLRLPAGDAALTGAGLAGFFGPRYCTVRIGKDRITTISLFVGEDGPHCSCAHRDPANTADPPLCT